MHVVHRARWRTVAAFAAIVALVATLLSSIAIPAMAAYPGSEGKIAFVRQVGNSGINIWTVNPDGTNEVQLTNSGGDLSPTWSPDGQKIAFTSRRHGASEVYVMNQDGSGQTRLTTATENWQDSEYPSWSPDQKSLVFHRYSSPGAYDLYTINLATGVQTALVTGAQYDVYPVYSPDGQKLAWGRYWLEAGVSHSQLIIANADASSPTVVRDITAPTSSQPLWLEWHPDSTKLEWAYSTSQGNNQSTITTTGVFLHNRAETWVDWSPSPAGNRLARRAIQSGLINIWLANLDGTITTKVTNLGNVAGITDGQPAWQTLGFVPLDTTKPTVSLETPTEGQAVVQGTSVAADYSCADDVAVASCVGAVANGATLDTSIVGNKTFTVTARDNAGNETVKSVSYTVVLPPDVCPNLDGNQASVPEDRELDAQGNCVLVVPPDATLPTISIDSPSGDLLFGSVAVAQYSCADNVAVASCVGTVASGVAVDTSTVGRQSLTVTASDAAGNTASKTINYNVVWPFGGFTGPVDGGSVVNVAKAGSTIPVKFSLGGDRGMNILATGYPKSVRVTCDGAAPVDAIEESTLTPGNNVLGYNSSTTQYGYNWKTDKAWKGTCRQLAFTLVDGKTYTANFKFS